MLLLMLVREFLAWTNMTYALKVCGSKSSIERLYMALSLFCAGVRG